LARSVRAGFRRNALTRGTAGEFSTTSPTLNRFEIEDRNHGGGDSAFDWAHQLRDRAAAVTLVHRSDKYRAHGATVAEVNAAVAAGGRRCFRSMSFTMFCRRRPDSPA
jgi:hypothetical protein